MTSLSPAWLAGAGLAVLAAGVLVANRGGRLFRCGWWLTVVGGAGILVAAIPWLGTVLSWLADPPSWSILPVIALGLGLVLWGFPAGSEAATGCEPAGFVLTMPPTATPETPEAEMPNEAVDHAVPFIGFWLVAFFALFLLTLPENPARLVYNILPAAALASVGMCWATIWPPSRILTVAIPIVAAAVALSLVARAI